MSKIDRIYVSCYAGDVWLARFCVASIRHRYPAMPISLIKDYCGGDFSTQDLERTYGVSVASTPRMLRNFGRLEIIFQSSGERFLYLDADTVITGNVIEHLEQCDEDFVVHPHYLEHPDDLSVSRNLLRHYGDPGGI